VAGVIGFRDPIFRGCTRPAMLVGVPMIPLLIITGTFMLASMWCMYLVSVYVSLFLIIAYVPIVVTMRQITKRTTSACAKCCCEPVCAYVTHPAASFGRQSRTAPFVLRSAR